MRECKMKKKTNLPDIIKVFSLQNMKKFKRERKKKKLSAGHIISIKHTATALKIKRENLKRQQQKNRHFLHLGSLSRSKLYKSIPTNAILKRVVLSYRTHFLADNSKYFSSFFLLPLNFIGKTIQTWVIFQHIATGTPFVPYDWWWWWNKNTT